MSAEQHQEPRVVLRDHHGAEISSLDTNHDGHVSMQEINPARPENGHDLVVAGVAGLAVTGALIVAAGITGVRRAKERFSVFDRDAGAD